MTYPVNVLIQGIVQTCHSSFPVGQIFHVRIDCTPGPGTKPLSEAGCFLHLPQTLQTPFFFLSEVQKEALAYPAQKPERGWALRKSWQVIFHPRAYTCTIGISSIYIPF